MLYIVTSNMLYIVAMLLQVQVVGFHISIYCLNSSKDIRFLYRFVGTVFHIILPLKDSACIL